MQVNLPILALLISAFLTSSLCAELMKSNSQDEDLDVDYSWLASSFGETNSTSGKHNRTVQITERHKAIALLVRNQLKKELRKLKSSMTDSVLAEVINYYGKRLDGADALKSEVEALSKRVAMLSHNLNTLGQNFKTISKSHRNLVDLVRNNMAVAGKTTPANAISRLNSGNLRKKSIDSFSTGTTSTVATLLGLAGVNPNASEAKLKQELLNDLETKYSNLLNEKLVEIILKNFKSNESSVERQNEPPKATASAKLQDLRSADCQDLRNQGFAKDGIYRVILPDNKSFNVFCEFRDNIGWTVLQRRFDGSVDFHQNWQSYKKGFGNLLEEGEFWLGLENMHELTNQRNYSLQVVMNDWKNGEYTAEYASFRVDSEANKFKLELGAYLENASTAGDSLGGEKHNHMSFSTYDSDNDMRFYDNCAQIFKSGWWFNACFQANLNGVYYKYTSQPGVGGKSPRLVKKEENAQLKFLRNGIHWNSIDFYKSLKSTKMRLRRENM